MDRLDKKIEEYLCIYGLDALNLVMERHDKADEKRMLFTIRYVENDEEKEREITKKMDELSGEIAVMDAKLLEYGVDSKIRPTIIKDIKKRYPDGWRSGFVVE